MNRIGARKLSAGADTLRFRFMRNRSGATMLTASPAGSGKVAVRLDAVKGNSTTEKASVTLPISRLASWFEKQTGLDLMLGQKFSVKEAAPLGRIRVVAPWKDAEEVEWALIKAFARVPTAQRDAGGNAYFDFPGDPKLLRKITPLVKRVGGQVMHLDERVAREYVLTEVDGHTHRLHLDSMEQAKAEHPGRTVFESSEDDGHSHRVRFNADGDPTAERADGHTHPVQAVPPPKARPGSPTGPERLTTFPVAGDATLEGNGSRRGLRTAARPVEYSSTPISTEWNTMESHKYIPGTCEMSEGFQPPASVASAAARGLELRREWKRGGLSSGEASKQGIGSGVQRATNLKNRDKLTLDTVKRMHAFFSRHANNNQPSRKESDGGPTAGTIAWLLWGGDAGRDWVKGILARDLKESRTRQCPKCGSHNIGVHASDGDDPRGICYDCDHKDWEPSFRLHEASTPADVVEFHLRRHLAHLPAGMRLSRVYEAAHLVSDQAVTKLRLDEKVEPFPIWVSMRPEDVAAGRTPKEAFDAQLADERTGRKTFGGDRYEDPEPGSPADHLAAMLAVGPYKREPAVWECPKCKGHNGRIREAHADTGMDCQEFRCPDCRFSTEDLDRVVQVSKGRTVDTRTGSEVRPFDGNLTQGQIEEATTVNPFLLPWPAQERDLEVERILQRLRSALGYPASAPAREGLEEDWRDPNGRIFTDSEMEVLYRFKSPSYIISQEHWYQRHFTRVDEGFSLLESSDIHPVRVDDEIGTRRKAEGEFWGPGKYETETLLKRRVYNRGKPQEYIVLETQRLVWNEADDSPVLDEDGSQRGFPMRCAYTPTGGYIGDPRTARFLCTEKGIRPECIDETHTVCSVGFAEAEKKWYGWSHRAIAGFGIGDRIFEEGFGDDKTPFVKHGSKEIRNMRDARRAAVAFAGYIA